jgi:hypothetical protein
MDPAEICRIKYLTLLYLHNSWAFLARPNNMTSELYLGRYFTSKHLNIQKRESSGVDSCASKCITKISITGRFIQLVNINHLRKVAGEKILGLCSYWPNSGISAACHWTGFSGSPFHGVAHSVCKYM